SGGETPPPAPSYYDTSCFKRGDLLEVPRTLFIHFGIYLGENRVAHLMPDILPTITGDRRQIQQVETNKRLILGVIARTASVRVDTVEDFAYGGSSLLPSLRGVPVRGGGSNCCSVPRVGIASSVVKAFLFKSHLLHFFFFFQFCETVKMIIRDQRSVLASVLVGLASIVCLGVAPSTTLPTIFIPFLLWMAG
ncbi:PREDICTED: lecithin retinol acyltransferase, partial [Corvus brachyrhynchos]|uniref:lecithin retinol acyltransferase n=1 Tax=Corvus brachyrhynchos TaxID=85066 RepID=UPI0004DDFF81